MYDAWGNIISTSGTQATGIGAKNSLRYRGYYYDTETGLYYLRARYYDPVTGRFINADSAIGQKGNLQSYNMFAYGFNNPVMNIDPTGNWPKLSTIFTIAAVAAVIVAAVALTVATCGAAAMAVVGGGTLAGASAGAATVATSAVAAAGMLTIAASTSSAIEKTQERKLQKDHTVYKLVDSDNNVQYVGRTTNLEARKEAHKLNAYRKDLSLEVIAS